MEAFVIILVVLWYKGVPSYTELALYARINEKGKLELINELDIYLGNEPEEILKNLEDKKYEKKDIIHYKKN